MVFLPLPLYVYVATVDALCEHGRAEREVIGTRIGFEVALTAK